MNIIKFSSDTKHRNQWFTGLSFSHPAKMSLPLQMWLIDNFTKEGETILDPMAGSGTILVACSMGRNVITVELEGKFVQMQKGNWEKIRERGCQMGYSMGTCQILQGDARNLSGLLADKIITSPPYADISMGGGLNTKPPREGSNDQTGRSSSTPSQIGAGKYDKIITSPPYTNRMDGGMRGPRAGMIPYTDESPDSWFTQRDQNNIGNLPYGSIDSVITSPPYEGIETAPSGRQDINRPEDKFDENRHYNKGNQDNIGNLTYGEFTTNVALCYNIDKCLLEFILEPKQTSESGQNRSGQNVPLDGQTNLASLASESIITVRIVGLRLIDELQDVNHVQPNWSKPADDFQTNIETVFVNAIKGCLEEDTPLKVGLKCLSPYSKVDNLLSLLTDAFVAQGNGENGGNKSLNVISLPAKFVTENLKKGKVSILSHITLSQLLSILNLSSKSITDSPYVKNAIIKREAIGEKQSSENYLSAMLAVYKSCFSVLKPGGVMVLVTKNFIRNQKEVRLDIDTIKLCEQSGFHFQDRWYRELTSQSFWRTIYKQKYPDAPVLKYEDCLIFQKRLG